MAVKSVAILGSNSLLAHHLLMTALPTRHAESPLRTISVWNLDEEFSPFSNLPVDTSKQYDGVELKHFTGIRSLHKAIDGADTIFNLHEVHDFSVVPDKKAMKAQNVEFVRMLLKMFEFGTTPVRLVHLSSIYRQVSSRWPNVLGRESADYFVKFRSESPFPAYCSTKHKAENLIRSASSTFKNLQSICVRVGPLYGEGDLCSLICDSILLSKHRPQIPLLGDQSGVIQMTYAGNAADALLKCVTKMSTDKSIRDELVLVVDSTPVRNFYDLAIKPLYEEDKEESAFQPKISQRRISFFLFYPLYCVLALICFLAAKVSNSALLKIPSPTYLYLVFHHWTFFSDFKLRIFFDYVPRFDYATSLKRSMDYYRKLTPDKITKYSWMP